MIYLFASDDYEDEKFENIKSVESDCSSKTFTGCTFFNCDFSSSDFSNSTFEQCEFKECNMGLTKYVNTSILGVQFTGCKLMGVSFIKCNTFGLDIKFRECIINNCNFSSLKLRKTIFVKCEITDTDFISTDLSESDFSGSTFSGAVFNATNLTKANFTNASGYQIHPINNIIKKAVFSLPDAISLVEQLDIIIR